MRPRVSGLEPDRMTDEQAELYRRFVTGPRADPNAPFSLAAGGGQLTGPPRVWLHHPGLGRPLEQLGKAIRFESTVEPRAREIAILMVAHHHRSPFELYAHVRAGAAAGLSPDDLDALARTEPPALNTEQERAVYLVVRRVLDAGGLSDDEYAAAVAALTLPRLIEVVTMVGFYTMVAFQLSVFGIVPPPA